MDISGKSLIAGQWCDGDKQSTFTAFSPLENEALPQLFMNVSEKQVKEACSAANEAFYVFAACTVEIRAKLLNTIAEQIMALGQQLIDITHSETGLPHARLIGERARTMNQLKAFAELLLNPIEPVLEDAADPEREPLPKPQTKLGYLPLGPVAVFGASNFPYAFSVAGGDSASALAAGCPVVVKGHPAHPATSELVAKAITKAIDICELPQGIFSLLQSSEPEVSHQLVKASEIKAVGFTGSLAVAKQLQQSINQREEQIPLYGELGSVNPQVILPGKLRQSTKELAESLTQSLLMGHGQFCTSPGIWFVPGSDKGFTAHLQEYIQQQQSAPLLTRGISRTFVNSVDELSQLDGVSLIGLGKQTENFHAALSLYHVTAESFIVQRELQQEVFGPFALVVTYSDVEQLLACMEVLEGQLTASIHGSDQDLIDNKELCLVLAHKVGRLIFNQMPTGVEICHSMNHGGPYPASTDVRTTSVGSMALKRYQRPICYQNMPAWLVE